MAFSWSVATNYALRVKLDVRPLVAMIRGEMYVRAQMKSGEGFVLVVFRAVPALGNLRVTSVMTSISAHLKAQCALDIFPSDLYVLDVYFICLILDRDLDPIFDDYMILQLTVTCVLPVKRLSIVGERCLSL